MAVYGWNFGALSEYLVGFERFVGFVVGLLNGGGAGGIKREEGIGGLLGDDTTVILLSLLETSSRGIIQGTDPLITSSRACSSPA